MDQRRAAGALLALAACIACSTAAPTASNQTALDFFDGPSEGCYYNFQHYGEGDRIMTNEPCLNCTCHNKMLMCYLKVCPFTKPIGQDCTIEKRADQCCPIVTCPDVPVDLLTSTSTSSPAEYGATGLGKVDKYGCSINGKYFPEGSKVPPTPNKPCEHCYCIRNMTTCVMQECTLHVDGCTPIYHKDVCCPVRYSCDHLEDEMLLLDDMTTTVRPTPGFLLTTTTMPAVTQVSQNCVHDDQIFADGALIKTEIACEHCYCMKGDIVCVVQECGTPMENEGKNCTSLPPRQGQCCPDTYICEGDELITEPTTSVIYEELTTLSPPRRVEGSGYRNEPDEPYTEIPTFEGSGEEHATTLDSSDMFTEKQTPQIIEEIFAATKEPVKPSVTTIEPEKEQNTIPDSNQNIFDTQSPETITVVQESISTSEPSIVEDIKEKDIIESKTTVSDYHPSSEADSYISKDDEFIMTTESALHHTKDISDQVTEMKPEVEIETTESLNIIEEVTTQQTYAEPTSAEVTTVYKQEDKTTISDISKTDEEAPPQVTTPEIPKDVSEDDLSLIHTKEVTESLLTTVAHKIEPLEATSINPVENEIDEDVLPPGRIPGEGDCLLNGVTYKNNTNVPNINNCHSSCKCMSSIVKCDPIICSPPPEHMDNMNDCQPIYDTPDACCPTYVCHSRETIPPESHSQMSGTESPKPSFEIECHGDQCLPEKTEPISPQLCNSANCEPKLEDQETQCKDGACEQSETSVDIPSPPLIHPETCIGDTCLPSAESCIDEKCQQPSTGETICDNEKGCQPSEACEGNNCVTELEETITKDEPSICRDSEECKVVDTTSCDGSECDTSSENKEQMPKDNIVPSECTEENCRRKEQAEENKSPLECTDSSCITHKVEDESSALTTESAIKDQIYTELTTEDYPKSSKPEKMPSDETPKETLFEATTVSQDDSAERSTIEAEDLSTEDLSHVVTEKVEPETSDFESHTTATEKTITEMHNKPTEGHQTIIPEIDTTKSKEQVTESIEGAKESYTDSPLRVTQYEEHPTDLSEEDVSDIPTKSFMTSTEALDNELHIHEKNKDDVTDANILTQDTSTKPTDILATTSILSETEVTEQQYTKEQEMITESPTEYSTYLEESSPHVTEKQKPTKIISQDSVNIETQPDTTITESPLSEVSTEQQIDINIKENVVTSTEIHKEVTEIPGLLSKPTEMYDFVTDKQDTFTAPDETQGYVTSDNSIIPTEKSSTTEENLNTQSHDIPIIQKGEPELPEPPIQESSTSTTPHEFDIQERTTETVDLQNISLEPVSETLDEHKETTIKHLIEASTIMPAETFQDDTTNKEPSLTDTQESVTDSILQTIELEVTSEPTQTDELNKDHAITIKYEDTEPVEPNKESTLLPEVHSTKSDDSTSAETEEKDKEISTSSQVGSEVIPTESIKESYEDKSEMPNYMQTKDQTQQSSVDENTLAPTLSYDEGHADPDDKTIPISINDMKKEDSLLYTTPDSLQQFTEKKDTLTVDHVTESVENDIKSTKADTYKPTEYAVSNEMESQNIVTHATETTTTTQDAETKLATELQTDHEVTTTPGHVFKEGQTESPMSLITEPSESIHSEDSNIDVADKTTQVPQGDIPHEEEIKTPQHYDEHPQLPYTESPFIPASEDSDTSSQSYAEKETEPESSFTSSLPEYTTLKVLDTLDKEKTTPTTENAPVHISTEIAEEIVPTSNIEKDTIVTQNPVNTELYPTNVLQESTSTASAIEISGETFTTEKQEISTRYSEVSGSITTPTYEHEPDTKPEYIPVKESLEDATEQNNVEITTPDSKTSETEDHGETQQEIDKIFEHTIVPDLLTTKYTESFDKNEDKETDENKPNEEDDQTLIPEQYITTEKITYTEQSVSPDIEIQSSMDDNQDKSTELVQTSDEKDVTTPVYQDLITVKEESVDHVPESHLSTADILTTESSEMLLNEENNRRTLSPGLETIPPEQYTTEKQKITESPKITKTEEMGQTDIMLEISSNAPESESTTSDSIDKDFDDATSMPQAAQTETYQDQNIPVVTETTDKHTTNAQDNTLKPDVEIDDSEELHTEMPTTSITEKEEIIDRTTVHEGLSKIPVDAIPVETPSEYTVTEEVQTESSLPKETETSEPTETEAPVQLETDEISVPIETDVTIPKATEPSIMKETDIIVHTVTEEDSAPEKTEEPAPEVTETSTTKLTEPSIPKEKEPDVTEVSEHKAPEGTVSEITESSVTETLNPKIPEETEVVKPEVTEASVPKITKDSLSETTEETVETKATEETLAEITETPLSEITEATGAESDISVPKETESDIINKESEGTTYRPKDEKSETPVEHSPTFPEPTQSSSSETTPYLIELQEHTTKIDEDIPFATLAEEEATKVPEIHQTERGDQPLDNIPDKFTQEDSHEGYTTKETFTNKEEQLTTLPPLISDKTEVAVDENAISSESPAPTLSDAHVEQHTASPEEQTVTASPTISTGLKEHEKFTTTVYEVETTTYKKDLLIDTEGTPDLEVTHGVTDSEDASIPIVTKATTIKTPEESTTQLPVVDDKFTKPEDKPSESYSPTTATELPKPGLNEIQPTEEVPAPDFPPSGSSGYGQEPDYVEEDQPFGPGTCRYGGKVYVSAQQIPRDDPCDFCFCFRSDIICLQQSCPPPIHGCHEEPIQGFCCPRYECPVSMATTLNVTTTTTTTTTTLPPHFLPHAYKGAAQRRGCQIKGHSYKVGEVVRASSGPCLHCTCGGDGQMKCDPKACTPEPMLRQMIAAAVSAKRRR